MVKYAALKGFYEIDRTIGCGGFAKVKLGTHIATGEKVAIKIMEKEMLKDDIPRVRLELKALKSLSHQHICKLYQVIETDTHFFIIVEYCSGGELFDHIVEKNRLSETESRLFFRQIVSAVAYLHSIGYAHRDLKPENVLLDKDQNLKLIDFGLCARPEGGIASPLYTSCGSPTYAAPELILGKQYLGPEVDVWAMGVLLYALLAGFLPFDDQSIESLYKKILSGKYEEPTFMSQGSRRLIRQMLQVNPKKRITVEELLSHPWMTMGILEPVSVKSESIKGYDEDCVTLIAQYYGVSVDIMWRNLKRWKYDYNLATYLLLVAKRKRGQPLKLIHGATKIPIKQIAIPYRTPVLPPPLPLRSLGSPAINNNVHTPVSTRDKYSLEKRLRTQLYDYTSVKDNIENVRPLPISPLVNEVFSPTSNFIEPKKPTNIRKPQKRIRSPNLDGDCSPVPHKRATPNAVTPRTPELRNTPSSSSESTGSARRVLGSIERSLNRVRYVLTPRKADNALHPAMLTSKNLCNVSTTQCSDPEYVITELSKALEKKGIHCVRKGFTLRGKLEPNVVNRLGGCSFELEICYLPTIGPQPSLSGSTPTKSILKNGVNGTPTQLQKSKSDDTPISASKNPESYKTHSGFCVTPSAKIGIRRKRLKGDSWCYKKVCEQVLALTATELKQPSESSV